MRRENTSKSEKSINLIDHDTISPMNGGIINNKIINNHENQNKQNVPINRGNYSMDTPEREGAFQKALSSGWENEYKEYRQSWIDLARNKNIRNYPLLVDLELSSKCNLRCPMCYTTTDKFLEQVALKFMDFEMYKRIILEIAGKVPAIRLSLRGESTLHKNFIEAVQFAKDNGIKEVSTLTHGKKLSGNFLQKLIDAGIDWITVSVDGMGEDYNKVRFPLKWEDTISRLKEIKELKDKLGLQKPVIKVQAVWPSIKKYPDEFYRELKPYTDLVAYNPLIDYLRNDTEDKIEYLENFSCPQLYQRVVVGSDGNVMLCSMDEEGDHIIGNANLQTIHEIWHGEKMNKAREAHSKKDGFKDIEICKRCCIPRKMEFNEKAIVEDREIQIQNYTNRAQEVGK